MSPGEFLTLDRCAFNAYNRKLKAVSSVFPIIDMTTIPEREDFKAKVIYPHMMKQENEEKISSKFVSKLDSFIPIEDKVTFSDIYVWLKKASELYDSTVDAIKRREAKKNGVQL